MSQSWAFKQRIPGSLGSILFSMAAFAEADDVYIFEHESSGQKIRVIAGSMEEAGEKISEGDYEDYD